MSEPKQLRAADEEWVVVARILRPHGLRGTFRLMPFTRSPEELIEPPARDKFHVQRDGEIIAGPLVLESAKLQKNIVLAKFEGFTRREKSEEFVNAELVVHQDHMWDPEDGFYIYQLEGLEARDADTKQKIGTVTTAREGAAHDYLVLDLDQTEEKETLLPLIPQFVPLIEIEEKFVEIRLPEGLLD